MFEIELFDYYHKLYYPIQGHIILFKKTGVAGQGLSCAINCTIHCQLQVFQT